MSITIIVEMRVKPGFEEAHAERLKVALPETKSADGCLELTAHRDQDQPGRFVVVERWTSREHYQAYLDWRTKGASFEAMQTRLAAPLSISFLDVVARVAKDD